MAGRWNLATPKRGSNGSASASSARGKEWENNFKGRSGTSLLPRASSDPHLRVHLGKASKRVAVRNSPQ